jgi:hypothetical protein
MSWWANADIDVKQKNRFLVEMGTGGTLFAVKSITKPAVTIESKEYKMINQFYNYPGVPKWEPITIKFVDGRIWGSGKIKPGKKAITAQDKHTSTVLWEMLLASGYVTPNDTASNWGTAAVVSPEKAAMIDMTFGSSTKRTDGSLFKIHQLHSSGKKSTETWTLYNPIITKISWGDLDYGDDTLVEYTLDIKYDWAEHSENQTI